MVQNSSISFIARVASASIPKDTVEVFFLNLAYKNNMHVFLKVAKKKANSQQHKEKPK